MTVMANETGTGNTRPFQALAAAANAVIFWLIAAVGAFALAKVPVASPTIATIAPLTAIVISAWARARLVSCETGAGFALATGFLWILLSIVAEAELTRRAVAPILLGPPDHPILRDIVVMAWIFGPALFVRRRCASGRPR